MPLIPNSPVLATPLLATPKGRQQLLMCYRDGLLNDTIAFWFPRSIDTKYGGFLHCFDHDGSVLDTDKSVWAQGRMSWMLLTLFNTREKRSEWLEWAEQRAVMESVAPNGDIVDHFDGRLLNPGHAIEGAWFILQEGLHRNNSSLIRLGCNMLDWMWERGWDKEFGGLFYFRDLCGKPVQEYWQDMKFWWPHNEAVIATLMAYELTGEEKYARWHQQIHDWSHQHFADPVHGEWFGYLHRAGQPASTTKGNLWKSFFHHPRMQWLCAQWLDKSPASRHGSEHGFQSL